MLIGIITGIFISNANLQQMRDALKKQNDQTTASTREVLRAENALKSEVLLIKDVVLFKPKDFQIELLQNEFLGSLSRLEYLIGHPAEINLIRHQHKFLAEMGVHLIKQKNSQFKLVESQQYFQVINSYHRDMEFNLNKLVEQTDKQQLLVDRKSEDLYYLQRIVPLVVIGFIFIVFITKIIVIWGPVIISLKKLQKGTMEIAAGNFNYRVEISKCEELEQLAQAFNYMAIKLAESHETLLYNTQLTSSNERLKLEIHDREKAEKELQMTFHQLKNMQAQLIQTEKMSSLGQLVAGLAHEINNPINFIYGNVHHTSDYTLGLLELLNLYAEEFPYPSDKILAKIADIDLEFITQDLPKIFDSMKGGAERIQEIILSLRTFSRLDEAEIKEVNINEGIDSTLMILQNRLKGKSSYTKILVIKEYGDLPFVECYPGQLNQVFMNIINNAIDAIENLNSKLSIAEIPVNQGKITIRTELSSDNYLLVEIADNGSGMTEKVKHNLFDPFFTTKPIGQGVGLGLSTSYEIIVNKHSGYLWCESELGEGTKFWIKIPLRQSV